MLTAEAAASGVERGLALSLLDDVAVVHAMLTVSGAGGGAAAATIEAHFDLPRVAADADEAERSRRAAAAGFHSSVLPSLVLRSNFCTFQRVLHTENTARPRIVTFPMAVTHAAEWAAYQYDRLDPCVALNLVNITLSLRGKDLDWFSAAVSGPVNEDFRNAAACLAEAAAFLSASLPYADDEGDPHNARYSVDEVPYAEVVFGIRLLRGGDCEDLARASANMFAAFANLKNRSDVPGTGHIADIAFVASLYVPMSQLGIARNGRGDMNKARVSNLRNMHLQECAGHMWAVAYPLARIETMLDGREAVLRAKAPSWTQDLEPLVMEGTTPAGSRTHIGSAEEAARLSGERTPYMELSRRLSSLNPTCLRRSLDTHDFSTCSEDECGYYVVSSIAFPATQQIVSKEDPSKTVLSLLATHEAGNYAAPFPWYCSGQNVMLRPIFSASTDENESLRLLTSMMAPAPPLQAPVDSAHVFRSTHDPDAGPLSEEMTKAITSAEWLCSQVRKKMGALFASTAMVSYFIDLLAYVAADGHHTAAILQAALKAKEQRTPFGARIVGIARAHYVLVVTAGSRSVLPF